MAALLPTPRGMRSAFASHRYRLGTAVRCPAHCEDECQPLPRSQSLCQNFLDTDERGQFRRRVGSPPATPNWFAPILTPYLLFVQTHRGLAAKTARKYTQKLSAFAQYLEGAGVTELDRITPGHVREFYEN